jgi:hypothetical protein
VICRANCQNRLNRSLPLRRAAFKRLGGRYQAAEGACSPDNYRRLQWLPVLSRPEFRHRGDGKPE